MAKKQHKKAQRKPAKSNETAAKPVDSAAAAPASKKAVPWFWALAPLLLAIALYANSFNHAYTLDDDLAIELNTYVKSGTEGIDEIMTTNYRHGVGGFNSGLYRPLSLVTFAVEESVFGEGPFWKHVNNALLYGLCGLLIFLLGTRMFPRSGPWLPLLLAMVFVAHPIHTEGVANIKGRDEVLAFLFFAATALLMFDAVQKKKPLLYVAAAVTYALAFLSKESSITHVASIPVLLYFFGNVHWKKLLAPTGVLAGMAALMLLWRASVMADMPPVDEGVFSLMNNSLFATDSTFERLVTAAWLQALYIAKLVVPYPLAFDYSYNAIPVVTLASWQGIAGILLVAGLLFFGFRGLRGRCGFAGAILFYFVTISVVANVFFMNGATFGERFAFTPSFAIAVACALFAQKLSEWTGGKGELLKSPAALGFAGVVLVAFSLLTFNRSADWESNLTLYEADIDKIPGSARAHYSLGTVYMEQAQAAQTNPNKKVQKQWANKGIPHLKKAIAILDTYWDAYNQLGLCYSLRGSQDSAVYWYNELHARNTSYNKAWFNKATAYWRMDQHQEGIDAMHMYLQGRNTMPEAWCMCGEHYGLMGDYEGAITDFKKCVELLPKHKDAWSFLGQAHGFLKRHEEAIGYFEKAAEVTPSNADVWFYLAITRMKIGQFQQALEDLQRCQQLNPDHPQAPAVIAECRANLQTAP